MDQRLPCLSSALAGQPPPQSPMAEQFWHADITRVALTFFPHQNNGSIEPCF
jgi:hypothetical protein